MDTRRFLFYILCLVFIYCKSISSQRITVSDDTVYIRNNVVGHVTCTLNGNCGSINWYLSRIKAPVATAFPGYPCSNITAGYYQTCDYQNNLYKLYFNGSTNLHGQTITCSGEACSPQQTVSDKATISIIVQVPSVSLDRITGQQIIVTAGQTTSITCVTGTSRPAPHILLYIGGTNVTSLSIESIHNATSQMYYTRSTLTFTPTKSQNGLQVNCKAYNTDNNMVELTTKPTLNVQYPPNDTAAVIVGHGDILSVTENKKLTLSCQVRGGYPLASITWNCFGLNGTALLVKDVSRSTITFTVNRTHNRRSCTCRATHPVVTLGDDIVIFNILYNAKLISFTISGGNFTIPEHASPVITCLTEGNPPPSITLRFVSNNTEMAHVDLGLKLEYMIPYARCEDTGIFRCEINNGNATNQQKGEKLNVICPPRSALSSNVDVYRSLKDKINITVDFIANPNPIISWYFRQSVGNEVQITDGIETKSSGMIYTTTLNIQLINSTTFGKYTVVAKNAIGIDKIFFDVLKKAPPTMPQNLASTIRTDTKVILQWQSGFNGGFEQTFQIMYRVLDIDKWEYLKGVVNDKGDTGYNFEVVSELLPGSQYIFAVYAVNPFGNSSAVYTNSSTLSKGCKLPETETMYGTSVAFLVIGLLMIIAAICISVFIVRKYRPVLGSENKNKKSSEEAYCELGDNREKPNVYDDCTDTQNVPASEDKERKSDEAAYLELGDNRENPNVYDVCTEKTNDSIKREQFYENASFKQ